MRPPRSSCKISAGYVHRRTHVPLHVAFCCSLQQLWRWDAGAGAATSSACQPLALFNVLPALTCIPVNLRGFLWSLASPKVLQALLKRRPFFHGPSSSQLHRQNRNRRAHLQGCRPLKVDLDSAPLLYVPSETCYSSPKQGPPLVPWTCARPLSA